MSRSGTITIEWRERNIEVDFNYSHDPGVHTYSNGDPGYPPSTEFEITGTRYENGNDLEPILDRHAKMIECVNPTRRVRKGFEWITEETPMHMRQNIYGELEEVVLGSDEFSEWDSDDGMDYDPSDYADDWE